MLDKQLCNLTIFLEKPHTKEERVVDLFRKRKSGEA